MKIAFPLILGLLVTVSCGSTLHAAETPDGTVIAEVGFQQPSLWARMKSGTANAWYKSTSMFRSKPAEPLPMTGSRASSTNKTPTSSYDANKAKVDGKSSNTVGDFLKQPRVGEESRIK